MRVSSVSSNPVKTATRREPQQDRATRRVAAFLDAAETEFARAGYEAATMTAVAELAGSSIGSLYSYFPDKRALALALLDVYANKIEAHWKPLFDEVMTIATADFAERFIDRFLDFVREHPAHLQLASAPIRLRRAPAAKRAFRVSLVRALRQRCPCLSEETAQLKANVILRIVSGMLQLYADSSPAEREAVVAEFKPVLVLYLGTFFKPQKG
jgi:AcrR family transcriptional regulator